VIELVVFDMAGTTVYDGDAVNGAFRAALAAAGLAADPAAVNTVMGLPKPEAISLLLTHFGQPAGPAEVAPVHADFVRRMKGHYATHPDVREMPGAAAVFAELRAVGVKVALDTGFSRDIADAVLARLGWSAPATVDAVIASDEVPRGRPFPDMIQTLMTRLGVTDPKAVAKVGDTRVDVEEGTNAGCRFVIGVTSGSYTREQLQEHPHTHIVASVADVPGVLFGGR